MNSRNGLVRAVVLMVAMTGLVARGQQPKPRQADLGVRSVPVLAADGLSFKDLNKNGRLDPYEDWRAANRETGERSRRPDDARGEGRLHGQPHAAHGTGRRASSRRPRAWMARSGRSSATWDVGRRHRQAHPTVHQSREHAAADDGHVAQRRPGNRGTVTARHSGVLRDQPEEPSRLAPASSASTRRAPASRSGRARSAWLPRAMPRWSRSFRASRRRSTSRSACAAPTIRRPTLRRSRAGGGSPARWARTPIWPATCCARWCAASRGRRSDRQASP